MQKAHLNSEHDFLEFHVKDIKTLKDKDVETSASHQALLKRAKVRNICVN